MKYLKITAFISALLSAVGCSETRIIDPETAMRGGKIHMEWVRDTAIAGETVATQDANAITTAICPPPYCEPLEVGDPLNRLTVRAWPTPPDSLFAVLAWRWPWGWKDSVYLPVAEKDEMLAHWFQWNANEFLMISLRCWTNNIPDTTMWVGIERAGW